MYFGENYEKIRRNPSNTQHRGKVTFPLAWSTSHLPWINVKAAQTGRPFAYAPLTARRCRTSAEIRITFAIPRETRLFPARPGLRNATLPPRLSISSRTNCSVFNKSSNEPIKTSVSRLLRCKLTTSRRHRIVASGSKKVCFCVKKIRTQG